jgi:uncharacterized protein (TIGR02466 family)
MTEITTNTPFQISVWQRTWDKYDSTHMIAAIEKFRTTTSGVQQSNNGGYQSKPDLARVFELEPFFHWIAETSEPILHSMNIPIDNIVIEHAWYNENRGLGAHNQPHIHQGILSGVFYVDAPQGSGLLNLINPAMNALWPGHTTSTSHNQHTADVARVRPTTGELYLWPSYLPHSVDPNTRDTTVRKSISFNITSG